MPNYLRYNPDSTPIANRVTWYGAATDHYMESQVNWLREPVLPEGFTVANSKVVAGAVELLSQADWDTIAAAQAAAQAAAEDAYQTQAKATAATLMDVLQSPEGRVIKAVAKIIVDELNILRAQHSLVARTLAQVKTAIVAEVNAQPDHD